MFNKNKALFTKKNSTKKLYQGKKMTVGNIKPHDSFCLSKIYIYIYIYISIAWYIFATNGLTS